MSQRKRFSFDDEVDDTIDLSKDDLKNSSITNNDKPSNDNVFADEDGLDAHKAVDDANFVLPRATNTKLSIGFTPEALIRFMWKRLCTRAQDQIREVAIEMKKLVTEINPDFAKELTPHCQYLMWCPEGAKCCGAYPTRKELKEIINERKNSNN